MQQHEKIETYCSAFNGRRDIVPRFWTSKNGSKSGYSPLCHNEWKEGVCQKLERKSCRGCRNADYIPLSDKHLLDHFNGKHTLGIYPLLQDNTCHLIVPDFDDHDGIRNPLQDARAFVEACELQDMPCYPERSKSGNGYHTWLFFDSAVPAAKARAVVFALLKEAQVIGLDTELSSFDRLFPNQDRQTGKGFGNLIALPLQGKAAKKGNTLLLDPETGYKDPYPKQMKVLEGIRRVSESRLDELIEEWGLTPGAAPAAASSTGSPAPISPEEAAQNALKCEFLAWARKDPTKVPEPLWYAMISNLVRLTGGFSLCHEASRGHPGYFEEETTRKIHQALDASGPMSCEWLRDNGFICTQLGRCKAKSPAGLARIEGTAGKKKSPPIVTDVGGGQKDYGHASVLSERFFDRFRWAEHRKRWMEFKGGSWRPIPDERITKVASDELRADYSEQLADARDEDTVGRLVKKIQETCVYSRMVGALSFLRGWDDFLTLPEQWDQGGWLFNVCNGTIDLHTHNLRPHSPRDLLTHLAPVDFDPQAQGPHWQMHIERCLPKANVRRQVQRDFGVSLVGETLQEKLPIWYGVGANAKSTTARVIMEVLGSYAIRAAPSLLLQKRFETHPTELADLAGRRLAVSVEVDDGGHLAEALVKDISGGDRKKARFMRGDFFEFEQTFSLVLLVNHRPIVRGVDDGIWRRLVLIPWEEQIPPNERRPQDEVVSELLEEGSAILGWMLEGLFDWQVDHHWTAPEVVAATDEYRAEQDVLTTFLKEACERGARYTAPVSEIHGVYLKWCIQEEEVPVRKILFGKLLKGRGIRQTREPGSGARVWEGVRLNSTGGALRDRAKDTTDEPPPPTAQDLDFRGV